MEGKIEFANKELLIGVQFGTAAEDQSSRVASGENDECDAAQVQKRYVTCQKQAVIIIGVQGAGSQQP